jgi:polysaccharide export outer membrane protein
MFSIANKGAGFVLAACVAMLFWAVGNSIGAPAKEAQPSAAQKASSYLIGANDLLTIYVWKEKELTQDVVVTPDGKISFPLIGEVVAAGRTVDQLRDAIADKLQKFVTAPAVTVIVRETRSQIIYTIGKVTKPGPYPLTPQMTVLQAVAAAGGFTDWADTKNVMVVRKEGGKEIQLRFNYKEYSSGENLGQNILLKAGDTIVVP